MISTTYFIYMDSPQFRYLNKKELSYIYEGNSNNVTLSSLLTLSHPFKYSQIIQSIKFSLNRIQQYYPMTRSYISMKNDKWCFCEKSFIIPSDSSSSSPIPQNFPPKQISSIVKSDILQNEIPFNWIKISSSNDTILNTLENLCSQEMTNDFIVENNLCRFTLVTSENFTNPSNSQIIDTTKEVGFVFCFLHTAFDEFKRILSNSQINMTSDLIIEQELKEGEEIKNNSIIPLGYVLSNLGICNQNIFDNDSTDNNIITDWNNVFLSSTAKSSRGNEDLRDFANNVLDLISQKNDHWVMYLPKNVFLEKYPSSEVTKECYSACYNFGV
uniref:Uncharacterized protein n=1 Tax=Rhizophagus irregularis (strain DAOM 181602 / DAOM 197198 / MUCL 43194) TaxID=747089 RepID=U9TMN5_RHIID